MTYKVMVTCPPMLKQIDQFKEKFAELDIDITTPNVVKTLTVNELIDIVPQHDGWIIGDDPATAEVFKVGKAGKLRESGSLDELHQQQGYFASLKQLSGTKHIGDKNAAMRP